MNIILTAQTGGPESGSLFREEIVKLRRSLKLLENKVYSQDIVKTKVFLRINGSIASHPGPTGIFYPRYSQPNKTFSAEIIITEDTWKNAATPKEVLSKLTKEFFSFMLDYLATKKIRDIDSEQLMDDIDNIVIENFYVNNNSDGIKNS